MWIYNIVFGLLVLNLKIKSIFLRKVIIFIMIMLSTYRADNIGKDTLNYVSIFHFIKMGKSDLLSVEIGYKILNKLVILMGQNEIFLFFIINLIMFFCLNKFIKYFSLNYELTLLIYFCFYYFNNHFNIIRHGIADSIFLYSLIFLTEKKIYKFHICILIASLFHSVAIVAIPLYYIIAISPKITLKNQALIITFILILSFKMKGILFELSEFDIFLFQKIYCSVEKYFVHLSIFGILGRIYIYILIIYLITKDKLNKYKEKVIAITYLYGFYLLIIFFNLGYIGLRLTYFFKITDIVIFTYFICNKNIQLKWRNIQKILLFLLLIYFLLGAYKNANIIPYVIRKF